MNENISIGGRRVSGFALGADLPSVDPAQAFAKMTAAGTDTWNPIAEAATNCINKGGTYKNGILHILQRQHV